MRRLYISGCQCSDCEIHRRVKLAQESADRLYQARKALEKRPKAPVIDIFEAFAIRERRRS